MSPAGVRERLLAQDERFRRLADEHERCEKRLEALRNCRWLSDDERVEQLRLKKRKLTLKDEMEAIVRRAGRSPFPARSSTRMKIAREALPFVVVLTGVSALGGWLLHPAVWVPGILAIAFVVWFFRDPERVAPDDPSALISPADGRIIRTGPDTISIFMNVFNVHVCRSPTAGRVTRVERHPGRFLSAFKDQASEQNERVAIELAGAAPLRFTLVAGLIARRIVCKVAPGRELAAGERVGLIQFGSRVDVAVPDGAEILVSRGQRVVAGETPIARLPVAPV